MHKEWIKINSMDDYPSEGSEGVLIACKGKDGYAIEKAWWRNGRWQGATFPVETYTHWMPLPEPPEDENTCEECENYSLFGCKIEDSDERLCILDDEWRYK